MNFVSKLKIQEVEKLQLFHELRFKTNINCGGCIKGVTPFLNDIKAIQKWSVDTENPDKILTVEGEALDSTTIINAVEDAGFDIVLV